MKLWASFLVAVCWVFYPTLLSASYFEFCLLRGEVTSVGTNGAGKSFVDLSITSSDPAKCGTAESDSPEDCARYAGQTITIELGDSVSVSVGDEMEVVQRLWVDVDGQWWNAWHALGECVKANKALH